MTFHDVTMTSKSSHFEFCAAILNPEHAVIQLTMTSSKIYEFVLRNIHNQNKHKKVKDYLLLTNEGEKSEKKTEKDKK